MMSLQQPYNSLKGLLSRGQEGVQHYKITTIEEDVLWSWVFFLEYYDMPLRPSMLGEIAKVLLAERDLNKLPSKISYLFALVRYLSVLHPLQMILWIHAC